MESSNPLGYRNKGASELAEVMREVGLIDERREQLGNEAEATRRGKTNAGITSTRIDRWYTPSIGCWKDILLTFEVHNTFTVKKTASDHYAVVLYIENQVGDLGHDRKTIQEGILLDREVQKRVLEIDAKAHEGNRSNINKWKTSMDNIREYLLQETAARRKVDNQQIKKSPGTLGGGL